MPASNDTRLWSDAGADYDHGVRFRPGRPPRLLGGKQVQANGSHMFVVGRGRLDRSERLRSELHLPSNTSTNCDIEIIAAAYERWGERCLERLDGEFAFIAYDAFRDVLFGARDRFGVQPLYYTTGSSDVAFCSSIAPLRAVASGSSFDQEFGEEAIGAYLVSMPSERGTTFFRTIASLPAGCSFRVDTRGIRIARYYELTCPPRADRDTVRHAGEAVRERLIRSVRERSRPTDEAALCGAMLSGGLDSSSVAALANQDRIVPTFSLVFPDRPEVDESRFIDAVVNGRGYEAHRQPIDGDANAFVAADAVIVEQQEPPSGYGLANMRHIYRKAADVGVNVLLDGHGGDEAISHGYGRLGQLARDARYLRLLREVWGVRSVHGNSVGQLFLSVAAQTGPLAPIAAGGHRLAVRLGLASTHDTTAWRRGVRDDLVSRTDLVDRYASWRNLHDYDGNTHLGDLANGTIERSLEVLHRAASARGVEARYPFLDRELVELTLSLPDEAKLVGGWTRAPLRAAMRGILPETVRLRRDKVDFKPVLLSAMLDAGRATLDRVLGAEADRISRYVDVDVMRAIRVQIEQAGAKADLADVVMLWRVAWLSLWLNAQHGRAAA